MREGRRSKGSFPLQGATTTQMAPARVNPSGKEQMGRMASLRPACLAGQAAPSTPSPAPHLLLARTRFSVNRP